MEHAIACGLCAFAFTSMFAFVWPALVFSFETSYRSARPTRALVFCVVACALFGLGIFAADIASRIP